MIDLFAHISPSEVPTGILLAAVGFVAGVLAAWAWQRKRLG